MLVGSSGLLLIIILFGAVIVSGSMVDFDDGLILLLVDVLFEDNVDIVDEDLFNSGAICGVEDGLVDVKLDLEQKS